LGRLASVLAKQLLTGQYVVAVRCEEIDISGEVSDAEALAA
jgi:large subunit ribosomal protein L13Ae